MEGHKTVSSPSRKKALTTRNTKSRRRLIRVDQVLRVLVEANIVDDVHMSQDLVVAHLLPVLFPHKEQTSEDTAKDLVLTASIDQATIQELLVVLSCYAYPNPTLPLSQKLIQVLDRIFSS